MGTQEKIPKATASGTKRPSRRLLTTLVGAFLLLSSLVLGITTTLETFFNFQIEQQFISREQQSIAEDAAGTVKDFIQDKFHILDTSANFINFDGKDTDAERTALQKLLGQEPAFRELVLFDAQKEKLAVASRLSQRSADEFYASFSPEMRKYMDNPTDHYLSEVYIDAVSNEPMMLIATPSHDVFGGLRGTIFAEINLKFMWELVGRMDIKGGGRAYVVNNEGHLIAYGDSSRVLKVEDLSHLSVVNRFTQDSPSEESSFLNMSKGIENDTVVSEFVPLGVPNWAVVVESPVRGVYEDIIDLLIITTGITIVTFILSIVLGLYLSRRITKPIIRLRDAARDFAAGKLGTRIDSPVKNEIGELAESFNEMAAQVKTSYEELEWKVKTRTVELQEKVEEMERMNKLMVGRELRMVELKREIEELKKNQKT